MWSRNSLTERLNLEWPILQAPMGDKTTPALAGAVSNAGALGGLGMSGLTADTVRRRIEGFRQLSAGSLNVNYLLWEHTGDLTGAGTTMRGRLQTLYDTKKLGAVPVPVGSESAVDFDHLSVLKDTSPEVISFHFGLPAPKICRELKANGIFLICSATTVAEALALEASGADAVIAQGTEAGGHRGTFTSIGSDKLISQRDSHRPAFFAPHCFQHPANTKSLATLRIYRRRNLIRSTTDSLRADFDTRLYVFHGLRENAVRVFFR